jgi:putative resolvase
LNERRRKLHRVLSDPAASVLVVEHHDRLARLGVELLQAALASSAHRLVVLDPEETTSDLAGDMTEVPTCMCPAVLRRAAKNRAARAIAVATGEAAK